MKSLFIRRRLRLPSAGTETFFLWGPRQAGKTTLLRRAYPGAWWIDLRKSEEYRCYLQHLNGAKSYGWLDFSGERDTHSSIDS